MKTLWITNSPFPEVNDRIGIKDSSTTGWVHSAAHALINQYNNIELTVASIYKGVKLIQFELNKVNHFLVPEKLSKKLSQPKTYNVWQEIIAKTEPDIVHIHGTEYPHSFTFIEYYGSKNVVVSIQGMVGIIERYYLGGIDKYELFSKVTIRDIFRLDTIFSQKKRMKLRGKIENRVIQSVENIIGRTSWDRDHVWAVNPKINYHFCNETLRKSFYGKKWSLQSCEKFSIFLSQGYYPIKGLHQLIKALPLVLKLFPNVVVYVAGLDFINNRGLKINGYGNYIKKLIKQNDLFNRIIFTGLLSEEEMCKRYLDSHVSVCPSSIENSSNSIGEAQILGVPCIASYVGGTPDLIEHGETGLLYRFEEYEMLAANICRLFSDSKLALNISESSKKIASERHNLKKNTSDLYKIYSKILINPHPSLFNMEL